MLYTLGSFNQATPPERFIIQHPKFSPYVRQRTRHVVLHNIYQTFANGAEAFSPDWPLLLRIWHESTAQPISDGLPQERILPSGGVYHVLRIRRTNKTTLRTATSPDGHMTRHWVRTKTLPRMAQQMLEEKSCCSSQMMRMLRMLTCRMMRRRLIPGQATSTVTARWPHRLSFRQQKRQTRP